MFRARLAVTAFLISFFILQSKAFAQGTPIAVGSGSGVKLSYGPRAEK